MSIAAGAKGKYTINIVFNMAMNNTFMNDIDKK